jgi:hypothetical protein
MRWKGFLTVPILPLRPLGRHVVRARGHLGPARAAFTRAGQRPWSHATDGMVRVRLNGTGRVFIVNSCSVPGHDCTSRRGWAAEVWHARLMTAERSRTASGPCLQGHTPTNHHTPSLKTHNRSRLALAHRPTHTHTSFALPAAHRCPLTGKQHGHRTLDWGTPHTLRATLWNSKLCRSSWNFFGGNVNEKVLMDAADVFVAEGLRDAGYQCVRPHLPCAHH